MDVLSRRSFLKKTILSIFFWLAIPVSVYYYAREIEPTLLTVNKRSITSSKINSAFDNFKIVHFSDTHIGFHYSLEQLNDLVKKINAEKPDIICFTGDLIDNPDTFNHFSDVAKILRALQAPFGKYWVYGNHDHGGYGTDSIKKVMESAQFTLLHNQSKTITKNDSIIHIAGLDDAILGNPNIEKTLENTNFDSYICLLAHEPDMADIVKEYPVDMQLSGHSHGGQIRLPFLGSIITPRLAHKYIDGEHSFNDGNMKLFVSRGIGTTRLPLRFLCKPEMSVYTLNQIHIKH